MTRTVCISNVAREALLDGKPLPNDGPVFADANGAPRMRFDSIEILRQSGGWLLLRYFWRNEAVMESHIADSDLLRLSIAGDVQLLLADA